MDGFDRTDLKEKTDNMKTPTKFDRMALTVFIDNFTERGDLAASRFASARHLFLIGFPG